MPYHRHRHKHHNQKNAQRQSKANAADAQRDKGGGDIEIDGTAYAQPQAICTVAGARPGVDGDYIVSTATHNFSRERGWIVKCALKLPGSSTGQDSRSAGSTSAAGHNA